MAAGPKEERINLEHEHDDDHDDKEELAMDRSGGAPPPKVSPIWLTWSPGCSLNAKMSTCAKVTGRYKSSVRIMVCFIGDCFEMCSDGNKRRGGASSTELGSKVFKAHTATGIHSTVFGDKVQTGSQQSVIIC